MAATTALPSSVAVRSGTPARLRLWPEWLTLSLYAAIIAFAIPFHEPWADEAQAWQLAGHSTLVNLFITNLRYEGHPALWYVLLKCLQHFGAAYTGMQWFAGLCATVAAALLIFRAPFPRIARLTLPFTFFLAYQYAVVARSYVLIPLLLFLVASSWKQRNRVAIVALWLGLLANVELHATVVSIGLAIVYYLDSRNGQRKVEHRTAAIILFLALYAIAALTVLPQPKDLLVILPLGDAPANLMPLLWFARSLVYVCRGLISLSWYVGLACLIGLVWALRKAIPLYYWLPLVFLAAFSGYYSTFWHIGVMVTSCIALAWISWPIRMQSKEARTVATFTITLAIATQLAYTVNAMICDHYLPYSGDLAAAQYLLPFVKAGTPIVVTYVKEPKAGAFFEVGLRPYIPGSIFMNEPDPFWKFSANAHSRAAFEAALQQHPPIVLVEYSDLHLRPFNLEREKDSRAIGHLRTEGYVLTHIFCGIKPEDLRTRSSLCHLTFELPSGSPQSSASKESAR